jgi:Xaa-Pro aminopeptidase
MLMPKPTSSHEARLASLREQLKGQGLDGFVIPISDEHMSEYVGAYAQRLEWLTGFNGSAGTAVVLQDRAAIFVEGRYTLQVRDQVDPRLYDYESVPQTSPAKWLEAHAPAQARIGYDPWLHTRPWVDVLRGALAAGGGQPVPVATNPVDAVWADQPEPSRAPAYPHPLELAGQSAADKRAAVARWLADKRCDAVVIAALDSVAWLLNLRGSDVACTPVALAFALVHADGRAELYIDEAKVTDELRHHLGQEVEVRPRAAFAPALAELAGPKIGYRRVAVDPERCVAAIFNALAHAEIVELRDPTVLPRATKNPIEQAGHRAAQARDAAAMAGFLHWLATEAPKGDLDELTAAARLHDFRHQTGQLRDLSFETISGAGPNGAVVHYRVNAETNRRLEPGSVYLVDSGGQYPDGTTDITRTVWIAGSEPPAQVRDRFTRVLKGHIALATATFPPGTNGSQLDTLARQYLWAAGLDYAHGTGHGVGSFLAVHEGPQRIAKAAGGQAGTGQELLPGMILSNEPGYYETGAFGIRIENLLLVVERELNGARFLGFETLTHVPIDRALVEPAMLTPAEIAWWNDYHAGVLALVGPRLAGEARAWLEAQCAPL